MEEFVFEKLGETVGSITICRPDKRNAFTVAMRRGLFELLRSEPVQSLHALVLRSQGTTFCAGADLKDPAGMDPRNVSFVADMLLQFRRCPPVIIAAVQGPALELGAGIAMTCDMVIAAPEASFGYPEVQHGLVSSTTTVNLIQYVGARKAFELIVTGDRIDAAEALAQGMINKIVPQEQLADQALQMASRIALFRQGAVHTSKRFFYEALDMPFAVGMRAAERVGELVRVERKLEAMRRDETTAKSSPKA